MVTVINIIRGS